MLLTKRVYAISASAKPVAGNREYRAVANTAHACQPTHAAIIFRLFEASSYAEGGARTDPEVWAPLETKFGCDSAVTASPFRESPAKTAGWGIAQDPTTIARQHACGPQPAERMTAPESCCSGMASGDMPDMFISWHCRVLRTQHACAGGVDAASTIGATAATSVSNKRILAV